MLALTAFRSYKGDDDIVYDYFDRKPTGREALIRIRWVILKTVTSLYGGAVLAMAVAFPLIVWFKIRPSNNAAVLLVVACVGVVSLAIGLLQNWIRGLCGRPWRPLVDVAIFKKNAKQWKSRGIWGGK